MSKRRLVITAVLQEYPSPRSATYGVSQGWISRLIARYRDEGQSAFEPRSRAPKTHPRATPDVGVELTHVTLLVHDLTVRVVNAATGELLRELTIDPRRDYQPTGAPKSPTNK